MPSATAFLVPPNAIVGKLSQSPATLLHTATKSFEPIMPEGSVLMGMVSVVVLSGLAFYVWQEQVVPVSRTKLALSKRSGAVKQYLDDLISTKDPSRELEQWLFTDWLVQREMKSKGQSIKKEPALPILKDAKWNSGDNPVIAATGLILICVVIASLTERIFQ